MMIYRYFSTSKLYDNYRLHCIETFDKFQKEILKEYEILDFIIKFHYCFEYKMNNFFRMGPNHNTGVGSFLENENDFIEDEIKLNNISLLDKISIYLGLDIKDKDIEKYFKKKILDINYYKSEKISKPKRKHIKSQIIKFNNFRNILYHGNDISGSYTVKNIKYVYPNFQNVDNIFYENYINLYFEIVKFFFENSHNSDKNFFGNILNKLNWY